MPDYSGLLQALAGEQQHYASQNPFIIGGQAVLKTPVYATEDTDPLQTALVQALQGLVGGFATSYGQGQVKTQSDELMTKLQTALAGAQQGGSLGEALLADPDTRVLGETAYLEEQIRKAADARKQKELENQMVLKGQYDMPESIDAGTKDLIYGRDPTTGKPVKIGEYDKPTYTHGGSGTLGMMPVTPEYARTLGIPEEEIPNYQYKWQTDQFQRERGFGMPTENKLWTAKNDVGKFVVDADYVLDQVKVIGGASPDESIGSAIARGTEGKLIKDSEAAELKRRIDQAIFAALKPNFPGAISDQERHAMSRVLAGDLGVPLQTIADIFERNKMASKAKFNLQLQNAQERGFAGDVSPFGDVLTPGEGLGSTKKKDRPSFEEWKKMKAAGKL